MWQTARGSKLFFYTWTMGMCRRS
uniref:Uncharacterized protein n=1 Tax=Anguilla anguilla TaxID=7936 RepID=A0A0E9R398_ANGAN